MLEFPPAASFHRGLAEDPKNASVLAGVLHEVTGRKLAVAFELGEGAAEEPEAEEEPATEEEIISLMQDDVRRPQAVEGDGVAMGMDMNKMLQQVQQMQADMLKAQEELANERVEASVGGGMVTVTASGAGEIVGVKISPEAIDPDDPETLEDLVLAGVNEALRNAQDLAQSKLGGVAGDLKGLGLPGL